MWDIVITPTENEVPENGNFVEMYPHVEQMDAFKEYVEVVECVSNIIQDQVQACSFGPRRQDTVGPGSRTNRYNPRNPRQSFDEFGEPINRPRQRETRDRSSLSRARRSTVVPVYQNDTDTQCVAGNQTNTAAVAALYSPDDETPVHSGILSVPTRQLFSDRTDINRH